MYVLRSTKEVPEYFEESFYDEVVSVRNGIALVLNDHVRDALIGPDFDYLGHIKDSKELEKFLVSDKKKADDEQIFLNVRKHILNIEDILPLEQSNEPEQHAPWIDTLGE